MTRFLIILIFWVCASASSRASEAADYEQAKQRIHDARNQARIHQHKAALANFRAGLAYIKAHHADLEKDEPFWHQLDASANALRDNLSDYEFSIEVFDFILSLQPGDRWHIAALIGKANTLAELGRFDECDLIFEGMKARGENFQRQADMAWAEYLLYKRYNYPAAKPLFRDAFANPVLHHRDRFQRISRLITHMSTSGNSDEALAWLDTAEAFAYRTPEEAAPYAAQLAYLRGQVQQRAGNTEAAKSAYRAAMAMTHSDQSARSQARAALENIEYYE